MIATSMTAPTDENTATYRVENECSTSGTDHGTPMIIKTYGRVFCATLCYEYYNYERFQRELEQYINKLHLDRPIFRVENQYPTKGKPFIRIKRRNRLIGKREKRIGLKR